MTLEELAKKHCYNGHNPETCELLADLREIVATERKKAAEYVESAGKALGEKMVVGTVLLDLASAIRTGV